MCVCASFTYIQSHLFSFFLFFFNIGWNLTVLHSVETTFPSAGSRPAFYFLFILGCRSMWCVQSASEAVSGSDQVVWPSGGPRAGQWLHCVTQVPLLSVTLPATETGRSKMAARRASCWCLSGSEQASFDLSFFFLFLRGSFSLGARGFWGLVVPALGGLIQRNTAADNLFGFSAKDRVGDVVDVLALFSGVQRHRGSEMLRWTEFICFFPVSVWKDGKFTYVIVSKRRCWSVKKLPRSFSRCNTYTNLRWVTQLWKVADSGKEKKKKHKIKQTFFKMHVCQSPRMWQHALRSCWMCALLSPRVCAACLGPSVCQSVAGAVCLPICRILFAR